MFNANGHNTIKVGMKVAYRRSWGQGPTKVATITEIELCDEVGDKYGTEVQSVAVKDILRCSFEFDDGFWAYGDQVEEIINN